jgi:hypothetical protein
MKIPNTRFLIVFVLITSCTYPSRYDAKNACENWIKKGGEYVEEYTEYSILLQLSGEDGRAERIRGVPIRDCEWEEETRQYLGFEKKTIKAGATVGASRKNYGREITRRFKY